MFRAFTISQIRYIKKIAMKMLNAAVPLISLNNWKRIVATRKISSKSNNVSFNSILELYTFQK
jgi:hypothetical protein